MTAILGTLGHMKKFNAWLSVTACLLVAASVDSARAQGMHDFDFEFGEWRVHHRVKRPDNQPWLEFDGTCTTRSLMDGAANVEEHRFTKPNGVTYGVAIRLFDAKTHQWAIWWVDSRYPLNPLDPPVVGRFENGVGTFYSDSTLDGKPTRIRLIWSQITPTSAHWEQAYSSDAGKTWETNWIMDLQRIQPK
jgi:hypothetical protein